MIGGLAKPRRLEAVFVFAFSIIAFVLLLYEMRRLGRRRSVQVNCQMEEN